MPGLKFGLVILQDSQNLIVVDVAQRATKVGFAEEADVCEELAEADVRGEPPDFAQKLKNLFMVI